MNNFSIKSEKFRSKKTKDKDQRAVRIIFSESKKLMNNRLQNKERERDGEMERY